MKTKIRSWFSRFALILSGVFLIVSPAFGATIDDLQRERQDIAGEINRLKKQASLKQEEVSDLERIVTQLSRSIAAVQSNISRTERQISETEGQIADLTGQIRIKEEELTVEQENQNEAIRVLYETTGKSTLEVLIESNSISSLISHSEYLEALEVRIEATIQEIERLRKELEDKRSELERHKSELDALRRQLVVERSELQQQRSDRQALLTNTRVELKDLKEQIAEMQALQRSVDDQILRIIQTFRPGQGTRVARGEVIGKMGNTGCSTGAHTHFEVRNSAGVAVDPEDYLPPRSSTLIWPFTSYIITTRHGDAIFYGTHKGLDIVATDGGLIRAVADGEVAYSVHNPANTYNPSTGKCSPATYGNMMIIRHDNGLISLYAHLQ
jgi:septal ring factor EnvC (AmiA/AmiB activator)